MSAPVLVPLAWPRQCSEYLTYICWWAWISFLLGLFGWVWKLHRSRVSPFSERTVGLALAASKDINLYKLQKSVERFAAEIAWLAGCIFPSWERMIRLS
eukprot:s30_g34.t1